MKLARKQKVLLLNDTTKWYHFGCAATSLSIKEEITKLGYKLTSLPITETYKLFNFPKNYRDFSKIEFFDIFAESNKEILSAIQKNDIIIINGEGTLHGVGPAPLSLLYVAYIAKKFLRKHIEIINHSVYPQDDLSIDKSEITKLYQLVYKTIDFEAIREPLSLSLMKKLSVTALESFDCLPLYIKNHYKPHGTKDHKTLLIGGSAAGHLNIFSNDQGNSHKFEQELSQFIDYINKMSELGYKIEFLYGAQDHPSKDDKELIAFIETKLKTKWTVTTAKTLDEWLYNIEKATILVSGRFHHTIAAACLGTNFIVLNSNTPKIDGLLQAIGNTQNIIHYNDIDLLSTLLKLSKKKQHKMKISLDQLCDKAMQNFKLLKIMATER